MTQPGGYPAAPEKKRPAWIAGGVTILSFVVLLYVIELFDSLSGHHLDDNGIRPLEADGLPGIIFATAIIWILGGFGTWLVGNVGTHCPYVGARCETNHIGASGLIFGWLAFLIVFGFFTRKVWEIVVGVIVLFIYGGVLLGVLPGTPGVSWQGHFCGAVAGVIAAYLLSGPERKAREVRKRGTALPPSYAS